MAVRLVILACLVYLAGLTAGGAPLPSTTVRVQDAKAREVVRLSSSSTGRWTVVLTGSPTVVVAMDDTLWSEDDLGRPRAGIRLEGSSLVLLERGGSPVRTYRCEETGWVIVGSDGQPRAKVHRDGARCTMLSASGSILGTVAQEGGRVVVRDERGLLRCTVSGLDSAAAGLWFLERGAALEESVLLVALQRWGADRLREGRRSR